MKSAFSFFRYNSKLLRQSFSVIFLFFTIVYMAVVIYAPSVAMSSVLGIDKWMLILVNIFKNFDVKHFLPFLDFWIYCNCVHNNWRP